MSMPPPTSDFTSRLFISRAGEDAEVAALIDQTLREAGYTTFIQDRDFGHTSFMERMAEGFRLIEQGGRVVAILSDSYQQKEHCLKEARYPLIDDTHNKKERLIVLRVEECAPADFLKDIPYVDLVPHLDNPSELAPVVIAAVSRRRSSPEASSELQDAKVERLLVFLENEDESNPEKAFLYLMAGGAAIASLLIAFDYFIDLWNWLFGTAHVVIFDTPSIIMYAIFYLAIILFGMFWHVRTLSEAIEKARLTSAQLRLLKERVKIREWKSKGSVDAAVTMATRKLTSGR